MPSLPRDSGLLGMAKKPERLPSLPGMISEASGPWETLPYMKNTALNIRPLCMYTGR